MAGFRETYDGSPLHLIGPFADSTRARQAMELFRHPFRGPPQGAQTLQAGAGTLVMPYIFLQINTGEGTAKKQASLPAEADAFVPRRAR